MVTISLPRYSKSGRAYSD